MNDSTPSNSTPPADPQGSGAPTASPVSKWALHRRLYDWTLSLAHKKHSATALFLIAFAESSFFPIPPDVLLAPLALSHRKRAYWFASICLLGSVLGAFLGYYIGFALIDLALKIPGIEMGAEVDPAKGTINWLAGEFDDRGSFYVFVAALTPIPFKLLTITAGFAKMNLITFFSACVIGRGIRFFGVAFLFRQFGAKAQPLIDRHFNTLCVIFTVLLVGGFLALKWIK